MKTLDIIIKEKANKLNLSILELSRESGVAYTTIMKLKYRKPSLKTLIKLSNSLNINIEDLINAPVKNKTK